MFNLFYANNNNLINIIITSRMAKYREIAEAVAKYYDKKIYNKFRN